MQILLDHGMRKQLRGYRLACDANLCPGRGGRSQVEKKTRRKGASPPPPSLESLTLRQTLCFSTGTPSECPSGVFALPPGALRDHDSIQAGALYLPYSSLHCTKAYFCWAATAHERSEIPTCAAVSVMSGIDQLKAPLGNLTTIRALKIAALQSASALCAPLSQQSAPVRQNIEDPSPFAWFAALRQRRADFANPRRRNRLLLPSAALQLSTIYDGTAKGTKTTRLFSSTGNIKELGNTSK